jgi:hypothetical protein
VSARLRALRDDPRRLEMRGELRSLPPSPSLPTAPVRTRDRYQDRITSTTRRLVPTICLDTGEVFDSLTTASLAAGRDKSAIYHDLHKCQTKPAVAVVAGLLWMRLADYQSATPEELQAAIDWARARIGRWGRPKGHPGKGKRLYCDDGRQWRTVADCARETGLSLDNLYVAARTGGKVTGWRFSYQPF